MKAPLVLMVAAAPVCLAFYVSVRLSAPALLWNVSPSEPLGLYLRQEGAPRPGVMIAFKTPDGVGGYISRNMSYLRRVPILKRVQAGEGDRVCNAGDHLVINGQWLAPIFRHDSNGAALPTWSGCRALTSGEFFVFSNLIPNSFDSRYYGPIHRAQIIGVFRPIITFPPVVAAP